MTESSKGDRFAAALHPGAKIQGGERFLDKHYVNLGVGRFPSTLTHGLWYGPWMNGGKGVKNRYLGIKFQINRQFHFGWARITMTPTKTGFHATLTGYAYETVPNKPIIAGATKGLDEAHQPVAASRKTHTRKPASLGVLALGAPGLPIWRREESIAATPKRQ